MTKTEIELWRDAQYRAWRDLACDESRWPEHTYVAVTVNYYTELLKKHVAQELTAMGLWDQKKIARVKNYKEVLIENLSLIHI